MEREDCKNHLFQIYASFNHQFGCNSTSTQNQNKSIPFNFLINFTPSNLHALLEYCALRRHSVVTIIHDAPYFGKLNAQFSFF